MSAFVFNARGRTIDSVRKAWSLLGNTNEDDLEFFQDSIGKCYVCVRSEESLQHSFVLDQTPGAFDECLKILNATGRK